MPEVKFRVDQSLSLVAAFYLLTVGYDAMDQFEQILDDTMRELENLGY